MCRTTTDRDKHVGVRCGFKTGYFRAGGRSAAAIAARAGQRATVVYGASNARARDAKAKELPTKGPRQLAMDSAHSARSASIFGVSPEEGALLARSPDQTA